MFSMYTFNRLTREFILDGRLAVDLPPVRRRDDGFGYDEVLSRFHNPFELSDVVREEGITDLKLHWYSYHPTPLMIAGQFDPREYRQAQTDLEQDGSWRGMLMCSSRRRSTSCGTRPRRTTPAPSPCRSCMCTATGSSGR
jgi:hypothetical protein